MRILRVSALAVMAVGASVMMMGAQGCGSELHKASEAAATIGTSLQTAASMNHDLIQAGVETPDQGKAVATRILRIIKANDVFIADLKVVQASGGQLTSASLMRDFQAVVDSADSLQDAGVLGIKDPASAAKFNAVIAQIRTQIAIIQTLLGTNTSQAPQRNPVPGSPLGLIALGALALTPEEIEKLIELAASLGAAGVSLVEKLKAFKTDTDAQLLDAASAADRAAEQQAIADGATGG